MTEDSEVPEGDICLRQANASDEEFLFEVYVSTREDELAVVDWSSEQIQAFLRQQFAAQAWSYKEQFPDADLRIIMRENDLIGRLYFDRGDAKIRLVDITLLPQHRNRGTGSILLNDPLSETQSTGKSVRLHVETSNRALRLYERLGFVQGHCHYATAIRGQLTVSLPSLAGAWNIAHAIKLENSLIWPLQSCSR